MTNSTRVLFYIPNLIGYLRLLLLLLAFAWMDSYPPGFVFLYSISILLDFADGWAARKFNQCSSFGAWAYDFFVAGRDCRQHKQKLSVVQFIPVKCVDSFLSTCFSQTLVNHKWGWILVSIEWITFVGNHREGSKWREANAHANPNRKMNPPEFMQKVMANGFKTWRGMWVIGGLHLLPLWIYIMRQSFDQIYLPTFINYTVLLILTTGRIHCLACELWCIQKHIKELLDEDDSDDEKSQ